MTNVCEGGEQKLLYCWIDHDYFLAEHNYGIGSFTSSNFSPSDGDDHIMFIPNPSFSKVISPFQARLLNNYFTEYNLELSRRHSFRHCPSRLAAIFLFETEEEAIKYKDRHVEHIKNRILRKARTFGSYVYSRHDSSWIDFLRLPGSKDADTLQQSGTCYWGGIPVQQCELLHFGKKWTAESIIEILYYGRVDFVK